MTELTFTVPKRHTDPIPFNLQNTDGTTARMIFTPPKTAEMMLPLVAGEQDSIATYGWLLKGLTEEDQKVIRARLADEADDFDWDTVNKIVDALAVKVAANRPTT